MNALKLVVSLLLIPRLFATFLLMPLALSLVLVVGQSLVTKRMLQTRAAIASNPDEAAAGRRVHPLHRLLFKTDRPLEPLKICDWRERPCVLGRFDVVIRPGVLEQFPESTYRSLFEGKFQTLHICDDCESEIIISEANGAGQVGTHVFSPAAYALVRVALFERSRNILQQGESEGYNPEEMLGERFFHAPGFARPANLKEVAISFTLLANIALLVMCCLWLALKAHRKVLDYFVGSGVLLPLVAATGRESFYGAIWILTLLRVLAFLLVGIPVVWVTVGDFFRAGSGNLFYYSGVAPMLLWASSIFSSMGLAMLFGSVADLKHKHFLASFVYKLLPFIFAMLGLLLWAITFLMSSEWASWLRVVITTLPISGIGPLLLAPILPPPDMVLVLHSMLSVAAIVLLMQYNARWFAVHLDDF